MKRSIPELQSALLEWYRAEGRASLPWRTTRDPYRVLVSEFMLQQTQADRVATGYERFLSTFPTFAALAAAPRADVVRAWKGLGYNLRAVRLHELGTRVLTDHRGSLPSDPAALRALPGIGPYMVGAIRAFAFGLDDVAIDVNVRRVVHRLCFGIEYPPKASASQIDSAARDLLPRGEAHAWNSAMMDLGATRCKARLPTCGNCPLRPWCEAAPHGAETISEAASAYQRTKRQGPQSRLPFFETRRFARGRVLDGLRELPPGAAAKPAYLVALFSPGALRYPLEEILSGLERDGLIVRDAAGVRLR